MLSQVPEIRWAAPALHYFIRTFHPTLDDLDRINNLLEFVRDHPNDLTARAIVEAPAIEDLEDIDGDVYVSRDTVWHVYFSWLPDLIFVVHVERAKN